MLTAQVWKQTGSVCVLALLLTGFGSLDKLLKLKLSSSS